MSRRRAAMLFAAVVAIAIAVAPITAAGASATSAKAPVCAGTTKAKALKAVKKTWNTLFDTTKTAEQRLAVVERATDPDFQVVITYIIENFGEFLKSATADIQSVKCDGKKHAAVAYDLVLNGQPAPGIAPPGTAVLVNGKWAMSRGTLCDLFGKADPALLESGPCAL